MPICPNKDCLCTPTQTKDQRNTVFNWASLNFMAAFLLLFFSIGLISLYLKYKYVTKFKANVKAKGNKFYLSIKCIAWSFNIKKGQIIFCA